MLKFNSDFLADNREFQALCGSASGPFSYITNDDDFLTQYTALPIEPVVGERCWVTKFYTLVTLDMKIGAFSFTYLSFRR